MAGHRLLKRIPPPPVAAAIPPPPAPRSTALGLGQPPSPVPRRRPRRLAWLIVAVMTVVAIVAVIAVIPGEADPPQVSASTLLDVYSSAAEEARARVAEGDPPAYVVQRIVLDRAAEVYVDSDLTGPNIGRVGATWPCDEEVTEESLERDASSRPNLDPESWAVVAGATYGAYCPAS